MTTTRVYTAAWTGETILPDTQETQLARTADDFGGCPLPRDGLPRITQEGIAILAEGLRGDFHRWRWSIGNHPLELPCEHVSNLRIAAMKDEPHYVAHAYTGKEFPLTYHNMVMVPWFVFDKLDTKALNAFCE